MTNHDHKNINGKDKHNQNISYCYFSGYFCLDSRWGNELLWLLYGYFCLNSRCGNAKLLICLLNQGNENMEDFTLDLQVFET